MGDDEEIKFIDAEQQFQSNKANSFREIIMAHLAKISQICTKEFKAGYWEKRPVATAGGVYMAETYREDTRDAYINAVEFLYDMLLPKFDKEATSPECKMVLAIKELESKRESIKDLNTWKDEKLIYARKIFQELSLLLKRLSYLEAEFIE